MTFVRIYSDEDGVTHLEDLADLQRERLPGSLDERWDDIPARGLSFVRVDADAVVPGFHNAPNRLFLVIMGGAFELEVPNGDTRRVGPGDAVLVEDVTGQGHISRGVADVAVIRLPSEHGTP
jgi:hypothetical protein